MHKPTDPPPLAVSDAPVLLAVLIAARRLRDDALETVARRELVTRHGIRIGFANEHKRKEARP